MVEIPTATKGVAGHNDAITCLVVDALVCGPRHGKEVPVTRLRVAIRRHDPLEAPRVGCCLGHGEVCQFEHVEEGAM